MTGAVWRPTFIDIEPEFNKFVPTFRNGKLVRDLVPDQPDMALNADYYFPDDHVIAELKCMETDSEDSYPQRVSEAFTHFRYSGSDLMGFLFRGEPNGAQKSAMWHCPRKRTFTRSAAFGNWARGGHAAARRAGRPGEWVRPAETARTCRSPVPPTPWRGFPKPAICGTAQHSPEPQGRQCGLFGLSLRRSRRSVAPSSLGWTKHRVTHRSPRILGQHRRCIAQQCPTGRARCAADRQSWPERQSDDLRR
jgi:hypothetical protein